MAKKGEKFTYGIEIPWAIYDYENKERINRDIITNILNKTNHMFVYDNLPETIPHRMLELMLQIMGNVIFTKVNDKYYVFRAGLGGVPNEYNEPTIAIVNNPALRYNAELEIGKDCVLIRNDTMMQGLIPIIKKYATLLTENEITINITAINERIMSLISGGTDEAFKAAQKYLDDIKSGKLSSIADNAFIEGIKTQPYGNTSQSSMNIALIEMEQYLKASMLQELGINANFNMKREALNSEESRLNDDALELLVNDMLECRKQAVKEINEMYGLDITVDFAGPWKKQQIKNEVQENEENSESDLSVGSNNTEETESNASTSDSGNDTEEDGAEDNSENIIDAVETIAEAIEEVAEVIEGEKTDDETNET